MKEIIVGIAEVVIEVNKEVPVNMENQDRMKGLYQETELMEKFQCKLIFYLHKGMKLHILLQTQDLIDFLSSGIENVRFRFTVHHLPIILIQLCL